MHRDSTRPRHRSDGPTQGVEAIARRPTYALAAVLAFLTEVAIAAFVHDAVIRPWLGDSLAVVLLYLALRAGTSLGPRRAIALAFAIACAIEVGQWFHLVDRLGLGHVGLARIVLGTGFDPADFLAYAGGAAAVLALEWLRGRRGG